jgi:TonB family protein
MAAVSPYGYLRPQPRVWWMMAVSAAMHVAVIAAVTLAAGRRPMRIDLREKAITTRLVKLGEPQPDKLLPRQAALPMPPPPEAPAPAIVPAPPDVVVVPPKPPETKKPADKPVEKREVTRTPPPKDTKTPALSREDLMAQAFSKIKHDVKATDPKGSPLSNTPARGLRDGVAGGDVTAADKAREGERYATLVYRHVRGFYVLPSVISDRERMYLRAVVLIRIDARGTVTEQALRQSSGNDHFDAAVMAAVRKASPLPEPPATIRRPLTSQGFELVFKP